MKVLIASGGSGGHIFPAVALAKAIKDKRSEVKILFVGSNKALDKRIFDKEGFRYHLLTANKLPYGISLELALFFVKLTFDIIKAFFIMLLYRPDVVIGFGGYVPCPVLCAALAFGAKRIIHEQNVVPGRANKLFFNVAHKIAVSFEETKGYLGSSIDKAVKTGNPIRRELLASVAGSPDIKVAGLARFGLNTQKFTILVVGGSQGSHFLNDTFIRALSLLDYTQKKILQVIHITGVQDYEHLLKAYENLGIENRVNSFVDRIEEAYAGSDIVLTRSGASAVFELAYFAKPMILVPYRFAMSHQAENAKVFADHGAAIRIDEDQLSPEILRDTIISLLHDKAVVQRMSDAAKALSVPDAADKLAGEVLSLGDKK